MKVLGLILMLVLASLLYAEQQYYGTVISSVTLSGSDLQTDLQVIPVHVGDRITPENIRAAIQAIYDTGHYSVVDVDAEPDTIGTALTFRVRPNYFFSTIRLEPEDLLERPLSGYFRLPFGEKFAT